MKKMFDLKEEYSNKMIINGNIIRHIIIIIAVKCYNPSGSIHQFLIDNFSD